MKFAKRIFLKLKNVLKYIIIKLPYIGYYYKIANKYGFKPGHYYSPIPDLEEIKKESENIFTDKEVKEVNLNTENQIELLKSLKKFYSSYPYNKTNSYNVELRYKKDGAWYRYSDSVFLYSIIRRFQPSNIIEVGSGDSSKIMLDTNELFFKNKIQCKFIEPFPERLLASLKEVDKSRHTIINKKVQSVKLEEFKVLGKNDILFIDSSHVSKIGSDLNYLLFEVLPSLNSGVLIHFHDIFYPFEMPKHWVIENRWFWNENYLLHAFLMNNNKYEIFAFNSYLQKIKHEWFKKEMPECLIRSDSSGSIWLKKL